MTKRMLCRVVLLGLVGLALSVSAMGQSSSTSGDSFVMKGVAADARGPLGGKVVLVMPIDARDGKAVVRYPGAQMLFGSELTCGPAMEKCTFRYKDNPDDARTGPRLNPQATTDAKGAFSVAVPRSLFKATLGCAYGCATFKTGVVGLAVFDGRVSAFEVKTIEHDPSATTFDAGRIVFEPAREPAK